MELVDRLLSILVGPDRSTASRQLHGGSTALLGSAVEDGWKRTIRRHRDAGLVIVLSSGISHSPLGALAMNLTRPRLAASVPVRAIVLFMLAACSTNTSQTTSSADHALSTSSTTETTVMASSTTETTVMASSTTETTVMASSTTETTVPASSTTETTVPASSTDGTVSAVIKGFKFVPDPITISVGDAITWTNEDLVGHTVTAKDDSFKTGLISLDDSATVTFATAGTFPYFCSPHPLMVGTVVVETTG